MESLEHQGKRKVNIGCTGIENPVVTWLLYAAVDDVLRRDDLVVAVCNNAHEELGPRAASRLHWSVPDPVRSGTAAAFERAFHDIADRISWLAPAIHPPGAAND